ncbi:MAG: hypothetical protein QOI20_1670 [Acidimicrobiaceae bacterium]|jgi:uncharacterized protein YecE (DUF72 family)|nr:hypothetical protein [Acidimicrobiaceae bacterium]
MGENDIRRGSSRILVGASSWSDRSLTHESAWYPKRSMRAAERIAYYTARFPLVEIDSTARFPPTPDVARQWAERTPDGFTIDVQAWSLLTGAATLPDSLWEDLREEVKPELRDRRRLYAGHLSAAGMAESWARFEHSLAPLARAGRLGVVLLRYPHWLKPGNTGRTLLATARARLPDYRLAVELQHPGWTAGDACEDTLSMLDEMGLGFVCVDGHAPIDESGDGPAGPVLATSSDVAVVRLYGAGGEWGARYERAEVEAWAPRVLRLAESAVEVHVLFANTLRDHAVANAAELITALREATG